MQWSGAECERSEQLGVRASEASGGGGAAGRPRIVAEGDVLRVNFNKAVAIKLIPCNKTIT